MRFANYEGPFTFGSRFEEAKGTNPEELIGAAIAGCFSMALSGDLGDAGHKPKNISTEASVEVRPQPAGGFAITKIHLKTKATVPDIDNASFQKIADGTRQNCPVSRALKAVPISLEATLA
jgi:osmotically inducible protein OsmC